VPHEDLETATRALAETVAAKLSKAVKIGKEAFYNQLEMPIDQAYAYTGEVMAVNMLLDDTAEGIAAFLEKRSPGWTQ
jgi:enoyl-CoA hydratase/carnithine racemase